MDSSDPAYHAWLMRNLDEEERNRLIAEAGNVIDIREYCERRALDGLPVSMPFPFETYPDEED